MTIEGFLQRLQKPWFVYRFAKAKVDSGSSGPLRKGAEKTAYNSYHEIQNLLEQYATEWAYDHGWEPPVDP